MTGRLHPADIEAIAAGVAECLEPRLAALEARMDGLIGGEADTELVDAQEIARRFGVRREWVYANAGDLGAVPLGGGPRPRIRFDPQQVARLIEGRERPPGADDEPPTPIRRRRKKPSTDADLLPILGEAV